MGPPGLWAELRRRGAGTVLHGVAVEEMLDGHAVAIDSAIWFHEAQFQSELVQSFGPQRAAAKVVFERCVRWLRKGVLPVVVLEGSGGGRSARTGSRGGKSGASLGPILQGPVALVRSVLKALGVPVVNAEGEAEATCAALVASGACKFAATRDFDALLFGATRVLKDLDLQTSTKASCCESWDLDEIQKKTGVGRDGLITAAAVVGCDYDTHEPSQSTASGSRGIGPRKALALARHLHASKEPVLPAFRSLVNGTSSLFDEDLDAAHFRCRGCDCCGHGNVKKACHGARGCDQCGTKHGCLPRLSEGGSCECQGCARVHAAGGKDAVRDLLLCGHAIAELKKDHASRTNFEAVVKQYTRCSDAAVARHSGDFKWIGFDIAALTQILTGVFQGAEIEQKIMPIAFEWILRCITQEKESFEADRNGWAVSHRFRWLPLSAKMSSSEGSEDAENDAPSNRSSCGQRSWYAVVSWRKVAEAKKDSECQRENGSSKTDDNNLPLSLPAAARRARLHLVASCGLLMETAQRPGALRQAITRFSSECPESICKDADARRTWGLDHGLPLVPSSVDQRKGERVHLLWSDASSGASVPGVSLWTTAEEIKCFGFQLPDEKTLRKARSATPSPAPGQRSLFEFMKVKALTTSDGEPSAENVDTGTMPSTPTRRRRAAQDSHLETPVKTRKRGTTSENASDVASTPVKRRLCTVPALQSETPSKSMKQAVGDHDTAVMQKAGATELKMPAETPCSGCTAAQCSKAAMPQSISGSTSRFAQKDETKRRTRLQWPLTSLVKTHLREVSAASCIVKKELDITDGDPSEEKTSPFKSAMFSIKPKGTAASICIDLD